MARKRPQQSAEGKRKATPKKDVVEEPLYWTPPVKKAGGVSSSKKRKIEEEETGEPLYYSPPKTPQEAIARGIIPAYSEKPADFLPHHLRLSPSSKPNPRTWYCKYGCEGVNHPVYSKEWPAATHDYYCIYWEILALFPEWIEDDNIALKPWHRPPRPPNAKETDCRPFDKWNRTEWYGFEKEAAKAAASTNSANGGEKHAVAFGGIVNQESPLNHRPRKRSAGRSGGPRKVSPPTWDRPNHVGVSFTITNDEPKSTRGDKRRNEPNGGVPF